MSKRRQEREAADQARLMREMVVELKVMNTTLQQIQDMLTPRQEPEPLRGVEKTPEELADLAAKMRGSYVQLPFEKNDRYPYAVRIVDKIEGV